MFTIPSGMGLTGLAILAVLLSACGDGTGTSTSGVDALVGKRIPGTSASWHPIAPSKVGEIGTVAPAVVTYDQGFDQIVALFEFPSSSSAAAFYSNPQPAARVIDEGPQTFVALTGAGPVKAPSQWLNRSWCVWTGGPDLRGIPTGAPFAITDSTGRCGNGAPQSVGIASISQRGNIVFIVQTGGETSSLDGGAPSVIASAPAAVVVAQNAALANGTLALLRSVGIR